MAIKKSINKEFVSEIDKKLQHFNATQPYSIAQQAEIDKYQRVHTLRDDESACPKDEASSWWED